MVSHCEPKEVGAARIHELCKVCKVPYVLSIALFNGQVFMDGIVYGNRRRKHIRQQNYLMLYVVLLSILPHVQKPCRTIGPVLAELLRQISCRCNGTDISTPKGDRRQEITAADTVL
jgi:hypothetical protein